MKVVTFLFGVIASMSAVTAAAEPSTIPCPMPYRSLFGGIAGSAFLYPSFGDAYDACMADLAARESLCDAQGGPIFLIETCSVISDNGSYAWNHAYNCCRL